MLIHLPREPMSHHTGEAWSNRMMDDSEKDRKFAKWLRFSRKHSANIFRNFCDEGFAGKTIWTYKLLLSACHSLYKFWREDLRSDHFAKSEVKRFRFLQGSHRNNQTLEVVLSTMNIFHGFGPAKRRRNGFEANFFFEDYRSGENDRWTGKSMEKWDLFRIFLEDLSMASPGDFVNEGAPHCPQHSGAL